MHRSTAARLTLTLTSIAAAAAPAAWADPLITPGGKPGAVVAWEVTDGAVTLQLAEGFDAADVAQAISAAVAGAKASVVKKAVRVQTSDPKALLAALESVDVEPFLDDVDAMLSALRSADEEEGSGSSIRARKTMDFAQVLGRDEELVHGTVRSVERARFPFVVVRIQVARAPAGLKGVQAGKTVDVIPLVRVKNGRIDPKDRASQLNAGAWYAQPGDIVAVRLGPRRKEGWIAHAFKRRDP